MQRIISLKGKCKSLILENVTRLNFNYR
uniref:Uncharacterized protein n=1 Tax=Arundo donax TaxID=35708 RepID=A0A0A8YVY5_ARUDO